MAGEKNGKGDFSFDDAFDDVDDTGFENLFDNKKAPENKKKKSVSEQNDASILDELDGINEDPGFQIDEGYDDVSLPEENKGSSESPQHDQTDDTKQKKRTFLDFEPDMDALLLTAQSSMIIEGIKRYTKNDFTSNSLEIYMEAQRGVELYIKILDRNPKNYYKLKKLVDSDTECQEVEKTAFNLYKKIYREYPETDSQKITAFEMFLKLFQHAVKKSSISKSMAQVKNYFHLSGTIDNTKVQTSIQSKDIEFKTLINSLNQHVKLAIHMLEKGKSEIAKGLMGKDISIFIIRSSELLQYYYSYIGNKEVSEYYTRINNFYKKYLIIG